MVVRLDVKIEVQVGNISFLQWIKAGYVIISERTMRRESAGRPMKKSIRHKMIDTDFVEGRGLGIVQNDCKTRDGD